VGAFPCQAEVAYPCLVVKEHLNGVAFPCWVVVVFHQYQVEEVPSPAEGAYPFLAWVAFPSLLEEVFPYLV